MKLAKKSSVLAFALCLAGAGEPDRQDLKKIEQRFGPPVMFVPKPAAAPVIDGSLDDPAWEKAQPVTLGHTIGAWWDPPTQKTEARVLADAQAVYFGVRCFESEPERIVRAGRFWRGTVINTDTVELLMDPGCWNRSTDYFHVIVTAGGTVYDARGLNTESRTGTLAAKVGKFEGGWTVEAAIQMKDIGRDPASYQIHKVWGLNIGRQRPELGAEEPKEAKDLGGNRMDKALFKLDDPKKYRFAEYTSWAPSYTDFSGYPFYHDSRPFDFHQRFGHALLEAGTQDANPPGKLFEEIFRADFDDGKTGSFKNAAVVEENFRGSGKCLALAPGQSGVHLDVPLENVEDVTLIMTFKVPGTEAAVQYMALGATAPDGAGCGAERYEFFMDPAQARERTAHLDDIHMKRSGAGLMELFDTHADMMRWKPCGRVRKGPGPWAMVEGYFSEPSVSGIRWPWKDWVILRVRLGVFRKDPGTHGGQQLVPRATNYPGGLNFSPVTADGFRIDDVVIFRGTDLEPPARVEGVRVTKKESETAEILWNKSRDNTLTAWYRVLAGGKVIAETHRLSAQIPAKELAQGITVTACDLYGNCSEPSASVK